MLNNKDYTHHNNFISFIVAALLTFALMTGLTQAGGAPLREAMVRIIAYTLSAFFLIFAYFMRLALLFFGVFAIFKVFQKKSQQQTTAEGFEEVQHEIRSRSE
jgi:hypothetical protein